jgi:hypothetical protein
VWNEAISIAIQLSPHYNLYFDNVPAFEELVTINITNIHKKLVHFSNGRSCVITELAEHLDFIGFVLLTIDCYNKLMHAIVYYCVEDVQEKFDTSKVIYDNKVIFVPTEITEYSELREYCQKYGVSPLKFKDASNYILLRNYLVLEPLRRFGILYKPPHVSSTIQIKGGMKYFNQIPMMYTRVYEYDFEAFFPTIIIKNNLDFFPNQYNILPALMSGLMGNKPLRSYLYGMLGNSKENTYAPEIANKINEIGRNEIMKLKNADTIIVATDAIFCTVPQIISSEYKMKTKVYENLFVYNGSTYFNETTLKGFVKKSFSLVVRDNMVKLLSHHFESTSDAYIYFKGLFTASIIKNNGPPFFFRDGTMGTITMLTYPQFDTQKYLSEYKKQIYQVCNFISLNKVTYTSFKFIFEILREL